MYIFNLLIFLQFVSNNKDDFLSNSFNNKNNNIIPQNNSNNNYQINSEIIKLKNEINNKDKIIQQQNLTISNLQNQLNDINNKYNNNLSLIKTLQNNLNLKEQELQNLKSKLNQYIPDSNKKWGFGVIFSSINQEIHYPIVCNENDLISRLEEELYNEYPNYKEYNTYLTCNGIVLKRFKTIGENNIKKGNTILVNIHE